MTKSKYQLEVIKAEAQSIIDECDSENPSEESMTDSALYIASVISNDLDCQEDASLIVEKEPS